MLEYFREFFDIIPIKFDSIRTASNKISVFNTISL